MKSKRQRKESISRSIRSAIKSVEMAAPQPFLHPLQIDLQPNLYPTLCHPVPYNLPPACCFQPHMPYITSDINNGYYNKEQLYYDPFQIHHASTAVSNVPPIQALEAHVMNYYKDCNQTHLPFTNILTDGSNSEIPYQPYHQCGGNLIHYENSYQNSNMSEAYAMESVSRECSSNQKQNAKTNLPSTNPNKGKSERVKFFRPFEN